MCTSIPVSVLALPDALFVLVFVGCMFQHQDALPPSLQCPTQPGMLHVYLPGQPHILHAFTKKKTEGCT